MIPWGAETRSRDAQALLRRRSVGRSCLLAVAVDGAEKVGLHALRHLFVACALDSGVTLAEAAVLARHASAKVTGHGVGRVTRRVG
jgi:hypothetical protein